MQDNPVIVREIKSTSNPSMMNVVFEQDAVKPVTNMKSLLQYANSGNPNFGPNTQKRIAFFNFSPNMIEELQFVAGNPVRLDLMARLVVHEFCEGDIIPEEVRGYYEDNQYYKTKTWKQFEGTSNEISRKKDPKMTPKSAGSTVLTYQGKPIYRETHFAMLGMIKDDILLQHDNKIVGSDQLSRQQQVVGAINIGK